MALEKQVNVPGQTRRTSWWRWRHVTKMAMEEISGRACGADVLPYFLSVRQSQKLDRRDGSD